MAGWFWGTDVETTLESGRELVARVVAVSAVFEERVVYRLRRRELHGSSAAEWESFGVTPAEAGYTREHDWIEEKVRSLEEALETLDRWTGLAIHYDVPPHAIAPSPTIYGACHWRVWFLDRWNVHVTVEYPSRSDCPSTAWVTAFEERIAHAFRR